MTHVEGWGMLGTKWTGYVRSRKIGKCNNISNFDMGQTVMAKWLGQISKIAGLMGVPDM